MYDEAIYQNIKSWIGLYGVDILDLLLPVKHCDKLNPLERYTDTEQEFYKLFDRHVNSWFHFAEKIKERIPAIAIDINQKTDVTACFSMYEISFLITFTTTPPTIDTDGDKRQLNIGYSEQNVYAYRDKMTNELMCMMSSNTYDDVGDMEERTLFSDMLKIENWEYPLCADIYEVKTDNFRVYNEMLSFRVTFVMAIENLNCEEYEIILCDNFEEN